MLGAVGRDGLMAKQATILATTIAENVHDTATYWQELLRTLIIRQAAVHVSVATGQFLFMISEAGVSTPAN